jgi:hypothetical protein
MEACKGNSKRRVQCWNEGSYTSSIHSPENIEIESDNAAKLEKINERKSNGIGQITVFNSANVVLRFAHFC